MGLWAEWPTAPNPEQEEPTMPSSRFGGALVSASVIGVVGLMILPLPGALIDVLLSINIGLAVMLLLSTILAQRSIDLDAFPSLLLIATLFRLALNVSTTRLILGSGEAGGVIQAFGSFVVGGSVVVGLVVFLILVVIQFVVITNGASRVAEVGARFTLDALPGKQMAIDADLGAGLIDENEARRRREEVAREADFYGAMDGASKFVKGDAIAGVLVTLINLIGGLAIGVAQQGLSFADAVAKYSILTVGDGLVSQVPALLISVASGILVTRTAGGSDLGDSVTRQLGQQWRALRYGGLTVGALGLAPGLPILPFATVGGLMFAVSRRMQTLVEAEPEVVDIETTDPDEEMDEAEQLAVEIRPEPLALTLAVDLVDLVDGSSDGDLLDRVRALRRKIAMEIGLIIPPVRTRDSLDLQPSEYVITVHGVEMGRGMAPPGHVLVIAEDLDRFPGELTTEPVFGLPAKWLPTEHRSLADAYGATLVDRSSMITTHLAEVVRRQAPALLSRTETKSLIELVRRTDPAVVDELTASDITVAEVQRVLQELLAEQVAVVDIIRILDVIGERARETRSLSELVDAVRTALGPAITQQRTNPDGSLPVVVLDPMLEHALLQSLHPTHNGLDFALEPDALNEVLKALRATITEVEQTGVSPALVTARLLRRPLKNLMALTDMDCLLLAFEELGNHIRIDTRGTVNYERTPALLRA